MSSKTLHPKPIVVGKWKMETTIMENQMEKNMENDMEYIGAI